MEPIMHPSFRVRLSRNLFPPNVSFLKQSNGAAFVALNVCSPIIPGPVWGIGGFFWKVGIWQKDWTAKRMLESLAFEGSYWNVFAHA